MTNSFLRRRRAWCALGAAAVGALTQTAVAAPAFKGAAGASATNATELTVPVPSGIVPGDVLLATVNLRTDDLTSVAAPSGWTLIRQDRVGSTAPLSRLVYTRLVTVADPASHRWKFRAKSAAVAAIAAYSGVNPSAPVRSHASLSTGQRTPQSIPSGAADTVAGDLAVGLFGTTGTGAITQPTGSVERLEMSAGGSASRTVRLEIAETPVAASTPLAQSATSSTSNLTNIGQLVVLAAASPPAAGDFAVAASPSSLSLQNSQSGTVTVTTSATDGFSGDLALSVSGAPAGSSAVLSAPGVGPGGSVSLTVAAGGAAPGAYTLTVRAEGAGRVREAAIGLVVTAPPAPPPTGTPTAGAMLPARLPQSAGATFHVSPSGSDANPGTADAPWRTIQRALDTLSAGQVALVRAGTYTESLMVGRGGTASAPVTIRNFPGERPVVTAGAGSANNMPLQFGSGAAYVRVDGLVIQGATGSSTANVYAWGGSHDIELVNVEVRGSARQGLYADRTTARIHVYSSDFHDNGGAGPANLDHNLYLEGTGHVVASSLIRRAGNGFGIQVYPSADRVTVVANTIVDNGRDGIVLGSGGSTTVTGSRIVGNVLVGNGRYGVSTYWGGTVGADNRLVSNLIWGNGSGALSVSGATVSGTIQSDPLFVARAAGDFRLQEGSPATSVNLLDYTPALDRSGAARPAGAGPDLGAYER